MPVVANKTNHLDLSSLANLENGQQQSAPLIDTGLACLVMLARFHTIAAEPAQLAREFQPDGIPFGKTDKFQGRWVSKLINLACLAPDIVERILDGTQPPHLTLQKLLVQVKLPADWQAQRDLLLV